jgi:hypothetical protein
MGIEVAKGEFCLLLSSHSLPMGTFFLDECIAPFTINEKIAACRCTLAGKSVDKQQWIEPEIISSATDIAKIISLGPMQVAVLYAEKPGSKFLLMKILKLLKIKCGPLRC